MGKAEMTEKTFLGLYDSWENNTNCFLDQIRDEHGWNEEIFEDLVDDLERRSLIEHHAQWDYRATAKGILFAEKQGIIPKERSAAHRETRRKILSALAELRKQKGRHERIHFKALCQEANIDEDLFLINDTILCEQGLVESITFGCYQITDKGMDFTA